MFALFFTLYISMFRGQWVTLAQADIGNLIKTPLNSIGQLLTSIFNNVNTPMTSLGDVLTSTYEGFPYWMGLVAFVLALITSIGIVVMAVKGIKKVFGIFFGHIR